VADGVGVADGSAVGVSDSFSPGVKMSSSALPMSSRTLPVSDGVGVGVDAPPSADSAGALVDGDGLGSGLSSEPESGEEPLSVAPSSAGSSSEAPSSSPDAGALVEAEGDGVAEGSFSSSVSSALSLASSASTQSLYSSIVRFFEDGLSSAWASVGVNPMPMRIAVGIEAMAIALPAGTLSRVNKGFFGAACRGPVLSRDSPAESAYWTSSAGTVPPVRPVGRDRS
jgi:hypothetical protein